MVRVSEKKIEQFRQTVWGYYHAHKREMPWRGERDPYKVLVSEIMLQQTQVSRVVEKYAEFIHAFPTITALANARLSQVLAVWVGLGYNRRARMLHELARIVVREYGGNLPEFPQELVKLPGIGPATAGSLTAFAFNKPVAFIETNIRRVFIHYFFSDVDGVHDRDIMPLVVRSVDDTRAREWYYALMDYGTHLAKQVDNPNKKSKHYTRQSVFAGSVREVRGALVKILAQQGPKKRKTVYALLAFPQERINTALDALKADGMVVEYRGVIKLQ